MGGVVSILTLGLAYVGGTSGGVVDLGRRRGVGAYGGWGMSSSSSSHDYVLRCTTCGVVYRMTSPSDWAIHGDGVEGAVEAAEAAEAVAYVLTGAVAAGTCDACYARSVDRVIGGDVDWRCVGWRRCVKDK